MKLKFTCGLPLVFSLLFGAVTLVSNGCKSYDDVASRYTSKHIKNNTNRIVAQIPETSELGYILISLTEFGSRDSSLINTNTAYYKEVAQYFAAFKDHKVVKQLNRELQARPANFVHFRNGLYAFEFNKRNRMVLKIDYRTDLNRVDFRRYTSPIQDFIKQSKFREFYAQHKAWYDKIIQSQRLDMSIASATIGKQYTEPFKSYQVIISPLMKGYSSSMAISGRGFRECLIFSETAEHAFSYTIANNR